MSDIVNVLVDASTISIKNMLILAKHVAKVNLSEKLKCIYPNE